MGYNNGGGWGMWGRQPSQRVNIDEKNETPQLVLQCVVTFVASMVLMGLGYFMLNTIAYRLSWLWQLLVRVALVWPARWVYFWIVNFLTGDASRYYTTIKEGHPVIVERDDFEIISHVRSVQLWAVVPAVLVWWFLAGDAVVPTPGIPFGEVSRYLLWALDFPESAAVGEVVSSLWNALVAAAFVSGCLSLEPLISRMRAEMYDRWHSAIEIKRLQMQQDFYREMNPKLPEGKAATPVAFHGRVEAELPEPGAAPARRRSSAAESLVVQGADSHAVFIQDEPVIGVRGWSTRQKKTVVVPRDKAIYFIESVASGKYTMARASWAPDRHITTTDWDVMCDVLYRANCADRETKTLTKPVEEILSVLKLRENK